MFLWIHLLRKIDPQNKAVRDDAKDTLIIPSAAVEDSFNEAAFSPFTKLKAVPMFGTPNTSTMVKYKQIGINPCSVYAPPHLVKSSMTYPHQRYSGEVLTECQIGRAHV